MKALRSATQERVQLWAEVKAWCDALGGYNHTCRTIELFFSGWALQKKDCVQIFHQLPLLWNVFLHLGSTFCKGTNNRCETQYSATGLLTAGFRFTRSLLCEVCVFHLWFLQFCLSVLLMRGCRSGNSSVPSSHYLRVAGSAGSCLLTRAGVFLWEVIMSDVKLSVSYFMQRCVQPQSFNGTYSGKGNVLILVVGMFRITKSICPTSLSF